MSTGSRGRKNAEDALLADFFSSQEDGLDYPEAFRKLVLDYEGIDKTPAYREAHMTDGSGDHGIDFAELYPAARSTVIYQFKSHDPSEGLPKDELLEPGDLTDVRRVLDVLESLGNIPRDANAKTKDFLTQLHLQLHQATAPTPSGSDDNFESILPAFSVEIVLAAFVGKMSSQAERELEALVHRATSLHIDGMSAQITIRRLLIDDLIDRKWREINVDWVARDGTKRDTITLVPRAEVIGFRSSLVFFARCKDLIDALNDFGYQLFEPNVRCEITKSKVNEAIKNTVRHRRGRSEFKFLNNGITLICDGYSRGANKVKVTRPGVINGLQTLTTLLETYKNLNREEKLDFDEHCEVLVRLHNKQAVHDYRELVKSTNNQNPMQPRNLRSNDQEQVQFERLFGEIGWFYERKQGAWEAFKSDPRSWTSMSGKTRGSFTTPEKIVRRVDNETLAQCWLAFQGFANEAVHNRSDIFDNDEIYQLVFQSRIAKHGADYGYSLDQESVRAILNDAAKQSPSPLQMLSAYLYREFARAVLPSSREHREACVNRLNLQGKTKEEQGAKLNADNDYVLGVVLQAQSYLFPEMVGYCLFKALGAEAHDVGQKLLSRGELQTLLKMYNFAELRTKIREDTWQPAKEDFLYVMWHVFRHCIQTMVSGSWKNQWMMAPNRTRFNYGKVTRRALVENVDELDKYIRDTELIRFWAPALNKNKGVFSFVKAVTR